MRAHTMTPYKQLALLLAATLGVLVLLAFLVTAAVVGLIEGGR